jgi:hypothetical protein
MIIPPITKGQKNTLIFTALLLFLLVIAFNWKSCNRQVSTKVVLYDTYAIDTLTLKLTKQSELNALYVQRISELEKAMDSLKVSIGQNKNKLTILKKRKKDESHFNYSSWTNNEFTKFLSDRYNN